MLKTFPKYLNFENISKNVFVFRGLKASNVDAKKIRCVLRNIIDLLVIFTFKQRK